MIWTDSPADAIAIAVVVVAVIWIGYACVPTFLRRVVINRSRGPRDVRTFRAAVIQVGILCWVWILHGAMAVWLLVPHEWWVVWGLFVVIMAGLGRTSHYVLSRLEETVTPRGR